MNGLDHAIAERDWLTDWLFDQALPLWSGAGTDWVEGGFFETIDRSGTPSAAPRRTRVVGRQLYAFATSAGIGWAGPVGVGHGRVRAAPIAAPWARSGARNRLVSVG